MNVFPQQANKICGRSRRKLKKRVTWWWNNDVSEAVKKKRKLNRDVTESCCIKDKDGTILTDESKV